MACHIREVWAVNLMKEFAQIARVLKNYPYISIDTEFPGTVVNPIYGFGSEEERVYQGVRANVNQTKLIQLGVTLMNEHGGLPMIDGRFCVWQFNFREFDMRTDLFSKASIELLKSCGIDFEKNHREGIDASRFRDLCHKSGLIKNKNVHYICFHGSYDFAYLLKLISGKALPQSNAEFLALINEYFHAVYDLKYILSDVFKIHGGLERLSRMLGVQRIGPAHQAGSDSLLTSLSFQKMKEMWPLINYNYYSNVLFGLVQAKVVQAKVF